MTNKLVLIDFSGIARPIYELAADPLQTAQCIVQKVRALASAHKHVALACDSRKSFRRDLDPTYKAQREATPAVYLDQCERALDVLRGDGFPVWSADGFEADDVIATAVRKTLAAFIQDDVLVISGDKDLRQLVCQRVEVFSPAVGKAEAKTYDEGAVELKYGVKPHQLLDYLCLVGDSSDNVKGAAGIGDKKAAALLQKFGNIEDLFAALDNPEITFMPSTRSSLMEFAVRLPLVRQLLTLRTDAPIPFEEIFKERVPADVATFGDDDDISATMQPLGRVEELANSPAIGAGVGNIKATVEGGTPPAAQVQVPDNAGSTPASPTNPHGMGVKVAPRQPSATVLDPVGQSVAVRQSTALAAVSLEWELEPRNMSDAVKLGNLLFGAKGVFGNWGTPEAVIGIVLAGRELGMPAQRSMRAFNNVDGQARFKADFIRALMLSSPKIKYFRCTERSDEACTFEGQRADRDDPPITLRFTIEQAKRALFKSQQSWDASGWGKNPADMLVANCGSRLGRLLAPDVVHGLISEEEL